ncbi:MAG: HEAT repeat domain-containing protein [Planctomycetes bacterium]|nr:HEAT repeat domain-containing protein [Planctomycetota bacterium]
MICAALGGDNLVSAAKRTSAPPSDLKVPAGFTVELVAGAPLVERPIVASFDDEGRLYVAESSGSNDPVEKQLELRPHRIARLEDTDGDGKFDRRTEFADRMMFPEGVQYLDGSVYVSAPPSIWRLTDTNDDGVADERVEWFQGKTLTGCANDLHGPYLGPDGWLYWCKGAFAEQTHIVNGRPWTTRAAHIFRCRPDGGGFEPVMIGGMDNPVDVVFTPEGERIFSATYLVGDGRRDGLAHAIYGGVYGKDHGVLVGHPRTGELMPALVLMSPTAPCGLERYDSNVFGAEYRDNLFACQFNLRKVSRHVLRTRGSSYISEDSDFVTSDNVDFHPTDVLMDADGSLLVIDTGGWYKLCCPTSQLWKPDVLGGIYRVRRDGAVAPADPRGRKIDWAVLSAEQLWALLCDGRPAVRQKASREFVRRGTSDEMRRFIAGLRESGIVAAVSKLPSIGDAGLSDSRTAALARAWTVGQIDSDEATTCVRELLRHDDESLRHAALNLVSLHRDAKAFSLLLDLLANDAPANRRAAAEALGRIGNAAAVPHLLSAAREADDRILQHSIIFALIELNEPANTRAGLLSDVPRTHAAALIALDQMPGGGLDAKEVVPLLNSSDDTRRDTARWLVTQHPEWGDELTAWFRRELATLPVRSSKDGKPASDDVLENMLTEFVVHPAIQQLITNTLEDPKSSEPAQQLALRVIARAKLGDPLPELRNALAKVVSHEDRGLVSLVIAAARELPSIALPDDALNKSLLVAANSPEFPKDLRVAALAIISGSLSHVSESQFALLMGGLSNENAVPVRSAAVDALVAAPLTQPQLEQLCSTMKAVGPLELNRLLSAFARFTDDRLGTTLLSSLNAASALPSLRIDILRESLAKYGPAVQQGIGELESRVNVDAATQRKRIEELLPRMAGGDVRRGHAVYHSSKAACAACHRLGHAGGTVGPELTRIGEARTERDLLESILYPSLSFVRSYEPVQLVRVDGRTINGAILNETDKEYVLVTGPNQEVRVPRDEVEQIEPSTVSVMPSGLDSQLSVKQLADLVAFLKNATGK